MVKKDEQNESDYAASEHDDEPVADDDYEDEEEKPKPKPKGSRKASKKRDVEEDNEGDDDAGSPSKKKRRPAGVIKFQSKLNALRKNQQTTLDKMIPAPGVTDMMEDLEKALRVVHRSFPHSRCGSTRDDYSYKRVTGSLVAFRRVFGEKMKMMTQDHRTYILEFLPQVLSVLEEELPRWDSPSNNALSRDPVFNKLNAQAKKSLAKGVFTADELKSIQQDILENKELGIQSEFAAALKKAK